MHVYICIHSIYIYRYVYVYITNIFNTHIFYWYYCYPYHSYPYHYCCCYYLYCIIIVGLILSTCINLYPYYCYYCCYDYCYSCMQCGFQAGMTGKQNMYLVQTLPGRSRKSSPDWTTTSDWAGHFPAVPKRLTWNRHIYIYIIFIYAYR